MGPLQTYFYLVLLGGLGIAVWLLLIGITLRYVVRGLRAGEQPLTFLLIGGAALVALGFVLLGTIGATLSIARAGGAGG
jgi:hypothetical protein